jgi:hypothetical protein
VCARALQAAAQGATRKRRWRPIGGGAHALEAAALAGGAGWRGRWGGDAEGRVAQGPSGDGEAGAARPSWVGGSWGGAQRTGMGEFFFVSKRLSTHITNRFVDLLVAVVGNLVSSLRTKLETKSVTPDTAFRFNLIVKIVPLILEHR